MLKGLICMKYLYESREHFQIILEHVTHDTTENISFFLNF